MTEQAKLLSDWWDALLKSAAQMRASSVEITRTAAGLRSFFIYKDGMRQSHLLLAESAIPAFYAFLQRRTRCMDPIDPDIDRGYGHISVQVEASTVQIDVYTVGAATDRVMDLVLHYGPTAPQR